LFLFMIGCLERWCFDSYSNLFDFFIRSGGERSFATVCLLLALGDCLESPFCAADEFDVCLDAESRRMVIKALIFVAKQMRQRQFIFITPQDLSGIQQDEDVTIHLLQPPRGSNNTGASQESPQIVTQTDV